MASRLLLVGLLLATCSLALASDPSPLQDFCVADPDSKGIRLIWNACRDSWMLQHSWFKNMFSGRWLLCIQMLRSLTTLLANWERSVAINTYFSPTSCFQYCYSNYLVEFARQYVLEELNVKSVVPCNDPLKYATLRVEPDFRYFKLFYSIFFSIFMLNILRTVK